jgi:hypothetical protein
MGGNSSYEDELMYQIRGQRKLKRGIKSGARFELYNRKIL